MLMVFGTLLFALAIQPRIAMVIAQAQQPMNGLFDHLLLRLGAATECGVIHRHQLSYRST